MSHLEERLEHDLQTIKTQVAEQATLVEEAIRSAIQSLQTGNKTRGYSTVLNDHPINRNMRKIDRLCHSFIAVHLPSAGHLRLLSAVIRVNIELERIGDYAVTIAREGIQLSAPPSGEIARELELIAGETQLMLHQAIQSFNDLNADMAKSTMPMAGQMERAMDTLFNTMKDASQQENLKDLFAMFVVFSQLKRVADQAKNICEETVFAVTGHQKAPKVYNILFVDEDNGLLSQMAEAVARINHPQSGSFRSAGRVPTSTIDSKLIGFLQQRNADTEDLKPSAVSDLTEAELAEQHVIVALQGSADDYFSSVPFHTSVREWDITPADEIEDERQLESLYRELALQIKDLMTLLRGEENA